jgi:multisubunit Na+/H+ antiporter MnhC subunit
MIGPDREYPAPPVGEEIHLPEPSVLPVLTAVGLTLIVIGTTISFIALVVGVVIVVLAVARWIADVRRHIDALPPDHAAPH